MGGYVNILSVYGQSMPSVPMNDVVFRYLHLKGINGRKMWSTWDTMHALLERGVLDVDKVLTHRMPVAQFEDAIRLAISGQCGKVVLDFEP
jgi:threonine 3-dehydrogenase